MKSKDIAVVGILLAIGAILRYFLAMLHTPLTPNMIIAFYCLAIILVRPTLLEAIGIGLVAGVLSMVISPETVGGCWRKKKCCFLQN